MKLAQYLTLGLLLCSIQAWGQQWILRSAKFYIEPEGGGYIDVPPDSGKMSTIFNSGEFRKYEGDTWLTLTAEPRPGFAFQYWDSDPTLRSATRTVMLNTNMTFTAHFAYTNPPGLLAIAWADAAQVRARITWSGGTLLSANDIMGPWTEVAGASSPYYDFMPKGHGFFRTRNEAGDSPNVVGYITLQLHYSALLLPFQNTTSTPNFDLSPCQADQVIMYDTCKHLVRKYYYLVGSGWYSECDHGFVSTISVGCGNAFIMISSPSRTWTVIGEVPQGKLDINIPAGSRQLLGSPVPQAGRVSTDLQYPAEAGDRIYTLDVGMECHSYYYTEFGWMPSEPRIEVGQAFWLWHPAPTELHWKRTLSWNP